MPITPNEKQKIAIDTLKNPLMLLAGPGTGKTFTIIQRIEKMLKEGIEPTSILCLTFSDAAANEMRQRLIKQAGVLASGVDIYTYHSFCNEIIKMYPSQFEMAANVRLIKEIEKIKLMKECVDEINLEAFVPTRGDKYSLVKNFISYIEKLKAQKLNKTNYLNHIETNPNLMPQLKTLKTEIEKREQRGETRNKTRYDSILKIEKEIKKAKELWDIYELYSNKMFKNNLIDFSDMITFVLNEFEKDKNFLFEVSNKYKYFLVDEYQDTNNLQNAIIFNLVDANKEKNILVVGDDDQIIYGFQGARIDNIENFLNKYPNTQVICLDKSNRSTQNILDFSYRLICEDENRLENNKNFKDKNIVKKLQSANSNITPLNRKVKLLHFGENIQEINYIIEEISNLVNSADCPKNDNGENDLSKIAIILKKRSELKTYAELLKGKNIPFQIDEGKSIFAIRSSILIYFYIKTLDNHLLSDDKLFALLLSEPFKLDLADYNKILYEKRLFKKDRPNDFIYLMKTLENWQNPEKIDNFLNTFESLKQYSKNNSPRETIIEIINRTGILEAFCKEEKNRMENLAGIKKIIDEASEFENLNSTKGLGDFVQYLSECFFDEIDISTDKTEFVQNAIQLTTFHSSKGREFDYVYLPNLIARNWEDFKMPGEYKLITDEVLDKDEAQAKKDSELLKLLFVGITRAKYDLSVCFSDMEENRANQITKYLAQIKDYDFDEKTFEYSENNAVQEFYKYLSRDVFDNQKAFLNEIKERVNKLVLSPSRLNDYISCPRKFFYTKILEIDVEDADWDNANFGTVIHEILENAVRFAKKENEYPNIEKIKEDFEKIMDTQKFTTLASKEKFEKRGLEIINSYYPHFIQFPINRIENIEYTIEGVEAQGNFITGKIDRIEKNADGTYCLYDYKTGNPSSEKKIATNEEKENYYNQLCFYKYAFEKLTNKKVSQTGIIYVEDHTKSVFKQLSEEDMKYIEDKIKDVCENIKNLNFNPIKQTKDKDCKLCAYKQLCSLDII